MEIPKLAKDITVTVFQNFKYYFNFYMTIDISQHYYIIVLKFGIFFISQQPVKSVFTYLTFWDYRNFL